MFSGKILFQSAILTAFLLPSPVDIILMLQFSTVSSDVRTIVYNRCLKEGYASLVSMVDQQDNWNGLPERSLIVCRIV